MMTYRIRPEYLEQWGPEATEETILTRKQIEDIAAGWDQSAADVLPQLIIEDEDGKSWEYIVSLMDDDVREDVHADLAPCTEDEFLEEYKKRHLAKFGAEFVY